MEPTDPPRPAAPSLLSGSAGKNDSTKDSGRILASLEKGPAAADTVRARRPSAAPANAPAKTRAPVLPLIGAGVAVGVVIWFLSGHVQPPGSAKPVQPAATTAPAMDAAPAQPATATILSTTLSPPAATTTAGTSTSAAATASPAPAATPPAPAPAARQAVASAAPVEQQQRSPLAVLQDEDDAARKAKKNAHGPKKRSDSDIRLIEALVSHVNGETPDDGTQPRKPAKTARTATTDSND